MDRERLKAMGDNLWDTLSDDDREWLAEYLTTDAVGSPFKRYSMDEINTMLDEAEARFDAGRYVTNEEVMRRLDLLIANSQRTETEQEEQFEMAIAV
jgi:predicted transcriptional regulator